MAYRTVLGTYYRLIKDKDLKVIKVNKNLIKVRVFERQKLPINHYVDITLIYASDYEKYVKMYRLLYI